MVVRMIAGHVEIEQERLSEFCRRYGVRRLLLFGSVLTDRFTDSSDIDVLVEFQPGVPGTVSQGLGPGR